MRGKGRKKSHTKTISMNTLLEKVLTEKSAREPEEMETLAVAQDAFETWA
jgi:hypothetical protein